MFGNFFKMFLINIVRFFNFVLVLFFCVVLIVVYLSDLIFVKGLIKIVCFCDFLVSYISILINICRICVMVEVLEVKRVVYLDEVIRVKK